MQHLQDAELKLPLDQQTNIYVNAIKTEGEAAEYIRRVTEAIHQAHDVADRKRRRSGSRKGVIDIAAAADRPKRGRRGTVQKKAKKKSTKPARKKSKPGRKA
jgi:hypothetical protein